MEERLEWEVEVRCEHSYNRRCAKTLKTRYEAAQVKKENKIQILNVFCTISDRILSQFDVAN